MRISGRSGRTRRSWRYTSLTGVLEHGINTVEYLATGAASYFSFAQLKLRQRHAKLRAAVRALGR
jgi:hypothetical protein